VRNYYTEKELCLVGVVNNLSRSVLFFPNPKIFFQAITAKKANLQSA